VQRVSVRLRAGKGYEIEIGAGALAAVGRVARQVLPGARRAALISNKKVFELYGSRVGRSLRESEFTINPWLMGDGERHKSLRTLERAVQFLSESRLERGDVVVALGGGVVGDLAGFAAAVYLRGVAFVQVPTTLLAQVDASVGGKTGVNTRSGKNLIGAFHQPRAVVIDTETLRTLPPRELTAGWCEALKQGAVGSRRLFDETRRFLADDGSARRASKDKRPKTLSAEPDENAADRNSDSDNAGTRDEKLVELIAAQCAFKAKIVAKDERESVARTDRYSRRVLNFGHTIGHALEAVTAYRRFRHGEAVGYGMLVAGEISERLGLLAGSELESLRAGVRRAGRLPHAADLPHREITQALSADKKSIGGHVQWVLLESLGRARIVGGEHIPPAVLRDALRAVLCCNH